MSKSMRVNILLGALEYSFMREIDAPSLVLGFILNLCCDGYDD
jgi:hypothetical protein